MVQRPDVVQCHAQAVPGEQWLLAAVGDLHLACLGRAGQLHGDFRFLLESELQVQVEHSALQPHGQAGGQVSQVGRQVQPVPFDRGLALAGLGKRRGLGR